MNRLRVFDINVSWWFWLTIFYEPFAYGESYFTISLWSPHKHGSWMHFWRWEPIPDEQFSFSTEDINQPK